MSDLKAKVHLIRLPLGDPAALPIPPITLLKGTYFYEREREDAGKGKEGNGRAAREGKKREGRGKRPVANSWLSYTVVEYIQTGFMDIHHTATSTFCTL